MVASERDRTVVRTRSVITVPYRTEYGTVRYRYGILGVIALKEKRRHEMPI